MPDGDIIQPLRGFGPVITGPAEQLLECGLERQRPGSGKAGTDDPQHPWMIPAPERVLPPLNGSIVGRA
jgi:hypothetical protein